jgi:signal transduction histidine kinase
MIACLLFSTHVFKKRIMKELRLIRQTSQQITQKNLETTMPQMKIKEFAQVIETLDLMQHTLKASLTKQWQEEQIRQNEIAALAHDLKTPITLIKGNAELLLEDELTEEQTEMTKTILQSSQQSKEYVDVMLATSIGQEEKFQWISSAQFVEEYLNPFLSNQSRVSVYLEKIGAQTINIQPLRIQRAVMNVANNALEYTAPSCKVTVKCRLDDSKGLKITIQDTGPGFSQEGLIHATDRFWKEDKARKLDGHQGLGLWFVKQVAQEHDGELTIENTLPGAKVTIYLPTPIVKLS